MSKSATIPKSCVLRNEITNFEIQWDPAMTAFGGNTAATATNAMTTKIGHFVCGIFHLQAKSA